MEENIEVKDVQKTEYLDKNGLDMLWAKVKENTHNQVEVERNRAVAKENSIVDTKADTTALDSAKAELDKKISDETTRATQNEIAIQNNVNSLSGQIGNFVRINELDQKVDSLNTAISAKQDKPDDGNMFLQVKHDSVSGYFKRKGELKFTNDDNDSFYTSISPSGIYCWNENSSTNFLRITSAGITLDGGEGTSGYAFTTNGKTARIPTKLSQLANDSNFITAADIDFTPYATIEALTAETTARTEALTALEQKVTANTTAIEGKQNVGNYLPYKTFDNRNNTYKMQDAATIEINGNLYKKNTTSYINGYSFQTFCPEVARGASVMYNSIEIGDDNGSRVKLSDVGGGQILVNQQFNDTSLTISKDGIKLLNGDDNHVLTSNASTIDITQYAKKTELPTVPTKTSQLTNDSNFMIADDVDSGNYYLYDTLNFGLKNNGVLAIDSNGIHSDVGDGFNLDGDGITFYARGISDIPTAQGGFVDISNYALDSQVTALEQTVTDNTAAIKGKQDKGNYIPYTANGDTYEITSPISVAIKDRESVSITTNQISISGSGDPNSIFIERGNLTFYGYDPQTPNYSASTEYTINGITSSKYNNCLATSDGTFKPISDFVLSSAYSEKIAALEARIAALEAKHPEATA